MPEDDIALMLAFKRGDYNAFALLVERHQGALLQYFYLQSLDLQSSEDCTQEVWRRVFRAAKNYTPKAQFKTYLLRIARNLWIDRFRSKSRRPTDLSLDQGPREGEGTLSASIASNARTPMDEADRRELRSRIEKAVEDLPDGQREVFVLSEIQGMKYSEVAEILEIPVGTVKSRMFNVMRRLRESLRGEMN